MPSQVKVTMKIKRINYAILVTFKYIKFGFLLIAEILLNQTVEAILKKNICLELPDPACFTWVGT